MDSKLDGYVELKCVELSSKKIDSDKQSRNDSTE